MIGRHRAAKQSDPPPLLELHMGDGAGRDDHVKRPSPGTWSAIETSPLRAQRVSGAHAHESGVTYSADASTQ